MSQAMTTTPTGGTAPTLRIARSEEPLDPSRVLELDDGARAIAVAGGVELRDAEDRIMVRYVDGVATIFSSRDLELAAPNGRVRVVAGSDITFEASRDVVHHGGRSVTLGAAGQQELSMNGQRTHLEASRLEVAARDTRLCTSKAVLVARTISTTAERVATQVERYELTAKKLVEKTRDAFRTVLGLDQHEVGRQRTVVSDTMSVHARRTVIVSKKDTTIDGERVLLG